MIKIYQVVKSSGQIVFETTNLDQFDTTIAWFKRIGIDVYGNELLFEI